MKKFFSKLWETKSIYIYLIFLATVFLSNYFIVEYNLRLYSYYNFFQMYSDLDFNSLNLFIFKIMYSIMISAIIILGLRIMYYIFVRIYNRVHHNGLIIISEIPLNNTAFVKFILIFSSIANIIMGLLRLLYIITPLYSYVIENLIRYIVYGIIILFAFYLLKKYVLSDRTAFATYCSMVIPFALVFLFF